MITKHLYQSRESIANAPVKTKPRVEADTSQRLDKHLDLSRH